MHSNLVRHGRIQRGGGGPDPPPLKNHKNKGFLSNTGPDPRKWQSYPASIQCQVIIGTPAKRHLNGVSLVGRWLPAYSVFGSSHQKKNVANLDPPPPPWQNFLDPRMWGWMSTLLTDFSFTSLICVCSKQKHSTRLHGWVRKLVGAIAVTIVSKSYVRGSSKNRTDFPCSMADAFFFDLYWC